MPNNKSKIERVEVAKNSNGTIENPIPYNKKIDAT